MPCRVFELPDGTRGIVCSRTKRRTCWKCDAPGTRLCDFPVEDEKFGRVKTCDRPMCRKHAHGVGINLDYCDEHFAMHESKGDK